ANQLAERLESVLAVIYLVFNEGYAATRGEHLLRTDFAAEAIRLARVIRTLMGPKPPAEVTALLALMLLHDARREARVDEAGDVVLLDEQDRSRWNRTQIAEALPLVDETFRGGLSSYGLQAAIAAEHCKTMRADETNWHAIVRLYEQLEKLQPTSIVRL